MKQRLILFLVIILLMTPISVMAQDQVKFVRLEVDLWPEYDSPEMLVIYRIELSPEVSLPVDLTFHIPAAAGKPNAVAVRDINGTLLNAPYESVLEGDWLVLNLTATLPELQIEYYDPQLTKNGSQRSFTFTWFGDYFSDSFILQLQQPLNAEQVEISPRAEDISSGSDGMVYHTVDLGAQFAGNTTKILVSYIKETDDLSIEGFQVQPSVPIGNNTSGRANALDLLPWGLGALGIILVVGGVYWYLRMGQQQPQVVKRNRGKRIRRRIPKASEQMVDKDEAIYCHQCGNRARSGDRFCRSCGSKLKIL